MEYEEIVMKFFIPGAENKQMRWCAEDVGLKAYQKTAKICNYLVVPIWNKITKIPCRKYTKDDFLDETKLYTKGYLWISQRICNLFLRWYKRYWPYPNHDLVVNMNYNLTPLNEPDEIVTHVVNDMIQIKKKDA